jgi:hypothetical protein
MRWVEGFAVRGLVRGFDGLRQSANTYARIVLGALMYEGGAGCLLSFSKVVCIQENKVGS